MEACARLISYTNINTSVLRRDKNSSSAPCLHATNTRATHRRGGVCVGGVLGNGASESKGGGVGAGEGRRKSLH